MVIAFFESHSFRGIAPGKVGGKYNSYLRRRSFPFGSQMQYRDSLLVFFHPSSRWLEAEISVHTGTVEALCLLLLMLLEGRVNVTATWTRASSSILCVDCLKYQNPNNNLTLHPKVASWLKCFGRYPVDIPSQRPSLCHRRYLDTMSRTVRTRCSLGIYYLL